MHNWSGSVLNNAFMQNSYANPFSQLTFYKNNLPAWVSMRCPEHFEKAYRFNPVVKATINLLANSCSNGRKYLIDANSGERIDWTDKSEVVQKVKNLIIMRPNPVQSGKEFEFQGIAYLNTFGNRYVNGVMPIGFDSELDIMNIEALYNLPSQWVQLKKTGKLYRQTKLEDIISEYAVTNTVPVERFSPSEIMHYNEVNISSEDPTILGISKLEVLAEPIANTQAAFEAMKSLLTTRGMSGIISIDSRDGTGSIVPLRDGEKKEVDETFKNDYGMLNNQNPFLLSPVPLTYTKTVMSSQELGIYQEFSNNSILISNEFNVPPELVKTYIEGATYENQEQSVKRLYQDATIPKVEEYDQYTNHRLNLEKHGVILKTDWSHIPALAANEKEKATTNSLNEKSAISGYNANLITWNQYLERTGNPTVSGGDVLKYQRKIEGDN